METDVGLPSAKTTDPHCSACWAKPCQALIHGGMRAGQFRLIHNHLAAGIAADCPYAVDSIDELGELLSLASMDTLVEAMNEVLGDLTVAEHLQYDHRGFITSYGDAQARIGYLLNALRAGSDHRSPDTLQGHGRRPARAPDF